MMKEIRSTGYVRSGEDYNETTFRDDEDLREAPRILYGGGKGSINSL